MGSAAVTLRRVKIGILSDTHDRHHALLAGIAALRSAGAEYFIHCGDVGSPEILEQLAGLPLAFVWGNTDFERRQLQSDAQTLGITCLGAHGILELDGKRIGVLHGDDFQLKRRLLVEQTIDYLLQGHTHVREDTRVGRIRVINPGALHRAAQKTVALLDLASDELQFLTVDVS